jgi:hypothetical protein
VKDVYNENCKVLKKEIKKTPEDGKTSQVHGLAES